MMKKILLTLGVLSITTLLGMSLSQLNSASKEDLMKINGIGEAKATAIIQERKKGKFKSFEDLQRVKGVGPRVASNIKNDITSSKKVKKSKKRPKIQTNKAKTLKTKTSKAKAASKKLKH